MDRLHPLHRQETSSPTTPMKILPTMRYCKSSQNFPAYQVERICTRRLGVFRLVSLLTLDNLICIIIRVGFVIFLLYYYRVPGYCDFRYVSDLLRLVQLRHTHSRGIYAQ